MTAKQDMDDRLTVLFGILTALDLLGGVGDVQTIRYEVAQLRGEELTRLYFVYALGVLAQRGDVIACDRLGYWRLSRIKPPIDDL